MKDGTNFQELTGDALLVQQDMKNPGLKPDIKNNDSFSIIVPKNLTVIAGNAAYHPE